MQPSFAGFYDEHGRAMPRRAWVAGLVRRSDRPSVLHRRHSGRLSHRSWLALPVLVMVWGVEQAAAVWAQHGGNDGQGPQRSSAVLLYGIIRHGDCPRGREPAHLMQPLC
jgi:hypothetical protein